MYNPLNHVYLCVFVCLQGENNLNQHAQPKWVGSCGLTVLKILNGLKDKGHYSHKSYYIQVCWVMWYVCGVCSQTEPFGNPTLLCPMGTN